jgi:hypothetical protein
VKALNGFGASSRTCAFVGRGLHYFVMYRTINFVCEC